MKHIYQYIFSILVTITLISPQLLAQTDTSALFTTKYLRNQTLTYQETIQEYLNLTRRFPQTLLTTYGLTDVGNPLYLFVISEDRDFLPTSLRQKGKKVLLINNAIHPGEPEGVDASLLFAQKILHDKDNLKDFLKEVVVLIVPYYNIDGGLIRSCCHRVNQNGPEELGFRGNARHLDLNRDFVKAESKNTRALINIFQQWDPDVFIDTHTTDGADYPYTMTLITTQTDKLGQPLASFVLSTVEPFLYQRMKDHQREMFPYINTIHDTPFEGVADFLELPRFATGYAALFQTIGFVAEANKYRPFPERVEHTYRLLTVALECLSKYGKLIVQTRQDAINEVKSRQIFDLNWRLDTTQVQNITYKGYPVHREHSLVTGKDKLVYDNRVVVEKQIPYYRKYQATTIIEKPQYYIVPQAWYDIIERLRLNNVQMKRLAKDTLLSVYAYYIEDLHTPTHPYEAHYVHSDIKLRKERQSVHLFKGDYLIPMNQRANYYLMTALEPQSPDSYFAWNFFDGVLMQKEWFTDYKFDATAYDLLQSDPQIKADFEQKKKNDPIFAEDAFKQLHFIFKRSKFYEKSHNRYPVYRIEAEIKLPTY